MNPNIEYASGPRPAEVFERLAALKAADARGELAEYRRQGYTRWQVNRASRGWRVVPDPASRVAPAPVPFEPPSMPVPRQLNQPRPTFAYPFPVILDVPGTAADRRQRRLRQVELDIETEKLRSDVTRTRRLRHAEDTVYHETANRLGGPILRVAGVSR